MKLFRVFSIFSFLLVALMFTSNLAIAAKKKPPRKFPHGCRQIGYSFRDQLLVLQPEESDTKPQTLYFINNTSHNEILLAAEKLPEQVFFPSFKNEIRPNEWGAFATDERVVHFRCALILPTGVEENTDCANLLELCQYNNVKFADHNHGNYWVVNSESLKSAIRTSITKGILLRW